MLQDKLREQLGACEQKHTIQMSLIINEHKLTVNTLIVLTLWEPDKCWTIRADQQLLLAKLTLRTTRF